MPNTKTVSVENQFAKAQTTLTDKMPAIPLNGPQGLKAIGPRVTFHFISDDWSDANTYEAYDVVQVAGTSYVAVKPVPKNIDISDTDYWFKWSEPNAQWQDLLNTVQSFDGRITANANDIDSLEDGVAEINKKLEKKTILAFGDSWVNPNTGYYSQWLETLAGLLDMNYRNYGDGGASFTPAVTEPTNVSIRAQIAKANSELTQDEKDNIAYIIIIGGTNDLGMPTYNYTNYINAVANAYLLCHTYFPQAKLYHYQNNCIYDKSANSNIYRTYNLPYSYRSIQNGLSIYSSYSMGLYWAMISNVNNYRGVIGSVTDYLHPSTRGGLTIANYIYKDILGLPHAITNTVSGKIYATMKFTDTQLLFRPYAFASDNTTNLLEAPLDDEPKEIATALLYLYYAYNQVVVIPILSNKAVLKGHYNCSFSYDAGNGTPTLTANSYIYQTVQEENAHSNFIGQYIV